MGSTIITINKNDTPPSNNI